MQSKDTDWNVYQEGLVCQYCGKECKNKNSLSNHERLCKLNPDRQISSFVAFNETKTAWNKGLTKETDERVLKMSLTYKANHEKGLHKDVSGDNNPAHNDEVRNKISKTCLRRSKEGTWHTSLAKNMHYNYNGIDLHGTYELEYAKYLDKNNIQWERCTDRFEYYYKDSYHYYTPDFYLVESGEFIEIKGYATGKDYAKWSQFPKDKKLKVLMKKDLVLLGLNVI